MFRMTIWNQTIPDALRGRLASIELVSYMSGLPLGHAEAGRGRHRAVLSVVSGGVLCVSLIAPSRFPLVGYDARAFRGSSSATRPRPHRWRNGRAGAASSRESGRG
jgi:hypothetical protein